MFSSASSRRSRAAALAAANVYLKISHIDASLHAGSVDCHLDHVKRGRGSVNGTAQLLFLQAHVVTPAILVAHSASSFVALRAAVRRPDLVGAVVLEDPPLYVSERGMPDAMRQAFEGMVQLLRSEMSHEQIVELIDSPRDEAMAETDLDAYELFLETWVGVSQGVDRLLRRLARPLLVLHGEPERGSMLPPEDRRRLVTQHPAARFAPWPGRVTTCTRRRPSVSSRSSRRS